MDISFIFKLILTFIVGSLWITYATRIAEKFGSKIGGILGGFPSTTVIGLFFIGWTQSPFVAAQSTAIMPIILGISTLFVAMYSILLNYNVYVAVGISLLVWFIITISLVLIHFSNFALSVLSFCILITLSYCFLEYYLKVKSVTKLSYKPSFSNLVFRGVLSGSIITLSVILAKIGGPILGGAFASFPAVMLSTMIITYYAHGKEFSKSVMKVLMLSGTLNVVVYAIAVRFLYPSLGLVFGTLVSFGISLISAYFLYSFVKRIS